MKQENHTKELYQCRDNHFVRNEEQSADHLFYEGVSDMCFGSNSPPFSARNASLTLDSRYHDIRVATENSAENGYEIPAPCWKLREERNAVAFVLSVRIRSDT
ncbi:hypothetical protein WN51_03885 [Melipona quadrifasciata]|uniref:Uncharacterized protein n=1 Tax=Melipona quadrifasciata TaxID=166423 RepID=A0A0M8ZS37_9HYME|nr:hypothetical protein WN51_03885 [Melipona quadrifasciata]